MKWLLLVMAMIVVALSGCVEKGPSEKDLNVKELITLVAKSSDNLSTYSTTSSDSRNMNFRAPGSNATQRNNVTKISEGSKTVASIDLAGYKVKVNGSTESLIEVPGGVTNTSTTHVTVYLIGNSTYFKEDGGNWTHLDDPRPAEEIWGEGKNNQVRALAEKINQSFVEVIGSEKIDGEEAYKLKISSESDDYSSLFNAAFGIAAKFAQYPLFMPSINSTELNESSEMENLVWISKETYLPKKFQSSMSFKITPIIFGGMNPNTGELKRFNQSMELGEVSVNIETIDLYYGFNKPVEIIPPEVALETVPIIPGQMQVAS
jgi:outer membrane lipoprotein-sorting protein